MHLGQNKRNQRKQHTWGGGVRIYLVLDRRLREHQESPLEPLSVSSSASSISDSLLISRSGCEARCKTGPAPRDGGPASTAAFTMPTTTSSSLSAAPARGASTLESTPAEYSPAESATAANVPNTVTTSCDGLAPVVRGDDGRLEFEAALERREQVETDNATNHRARRSGERYGGI